MASSPCTWLWFFETTSRYSTFVIRSCVCISDYVVPHCPCNLGLGCEARANRHTCSCSSPRCWLSLNKTRGLPHQSFTFEPNCYQKFYQSIFLGQEAEEIEQPEERSKSGARRNHVFQNGRAAGRKNWLFAGSDNGGQTAATIYSLVETTKLNKINPQVYLAKVLSVIQDYKSTKLAELLPWSIIIPDIVAPG